MVNLPRRLPWLMIVLGLGLLAALPFAAAQDKPAPNAIPTLTADQIRPILKAIREKHKLPALGAAVAYVDRDPVYAADGLRALGKTEKVTDLDHFHLGSCTKSMTATLVAMLVEEGKLKWKDPLDKLLPALKNKMHDANRALTLEHLLTHRAGLPTNPRVKMSGPDPNSYPDSDPTIRKLRLNYAASVLALEPVEPPGTKFIYANDGYIIAGVVLETVTGKSWEKLINEKLFKPLGMKSAGFGSMGTFDKVDQPWQHRGKDAASVVAIPPSPVSDNPPILGPAGRVHASLPDWAKYIRFHLQGGAGKPVSLPIKDFKTLHTPLFSGNYSPGGWISVYRPWAGGLALMHNGTNTMNFAITWVAPKRGFALLTVCNQGGEVAEKACDEVNVKLLTLLNALK